MIVAGLMLIVNPFDVHVAARLLDFFDYRTPWHRRLWTSGLILTLQEVFEASEMVASGVLFQPVLKDLTGTAIELAGRDPAVGPRLSKKKLHEILTTDLEYRSIQHLELAQMTSDIGAGYLKRWADALRTQTASLDLKPERTARAIAAHLLDAGFSAEFLFGWWRGRIQRDQGQQALADMVEEAHSLAKQSERTYEVLVLFREAPGNSSRTPGEWLTATDASKWISKNGFKSEGLRQMGGMWLEVSARDVWRAVQAAAEIVDRFASRVQLGTRGQLSPLSQVYVKGHKSVYPLRERRRRVEVYALHRENQLYSLGSKASRVDSAIELLSPLDASSPSAAVAGGWAAIEAMLSGPGDEKRDSAGDRMAALVACSFPRAELTVLSYKAEVLAARRATELAACATNRDRAALIARYIRHGESLPLTSQSDIAALARIEAVLKTPSKSLGDIRNHLSAVFRRLYRNRNIVLHGGKTDAVGLRAVLQRAAPLVGAGMDRIAHAWFVEGIEPLQLAARAAVRLATVDSPDSTQIVDLLV